MEADEAVLVVGLEHQEDNRRNKGDIGKHAGDVIGESANGGRCCGLAAATTLGTGRAIRDLRSTTGTKSHEGSPWYARNLYQANGLLHGDYGQGPELGSKERYQKWELGAMQRTRERN